MLTVESVVAVLYLSVPVISSVGWVPQVARLVRDPSLGSGMSLPTWGVWSFTGFVSLLYSIMIVGDLPLIVTMLVNALGQILVFAYAVSARISHSQSK